MKRVLLGILVCGISGSLFAAGGVCKKCEKIRKYNAEHPSKYVYFEDYLKDQEKEDDEEEEKDFELDADSNIKSPSQNTKNTPKKK